MAKLTKQEAANICGWATNKLSVYITRGKLIVKDNMIDTANPTNIAFFEKYRKEEETQPASSEPVKQIPREETYIDPALVLKPDTDEDTTIPSVKASEKRYKAALARKTEASDIHERLKIEKLKGEVVPTAPIEGLVFKFKQHLLTQQKITCEQFLNEVGHKYEMTPEDMAYFRGFFTKKINDAMVSASDSFKQELAGTLATFSVKK